MEERPQNTVGIRVLQVGLGLTLLFRVSTEGRFSSFLWGPNGIGSGSAQAIFGSTIGRYLDSLFTSELGTRLVVFALALAAVGLITGYRTRTSTLVALISFTLLEFRLPELGDGGDNLLNILLVYMLLLAPSGDSHPEKSLSTWMHNLGLMAMWTQLIIVYATSGFMKARGAAWNNGTALYLITQVEWFKEPGLQGIFKNPAITTLCTYATIWYQLWFPVGIFSRFKNLFIIVGLCMHLGIAIFMGLITFSMVMISVELSLISDKDYEILNGKLNACRAYLASRMPFHRGSAEQPDRVADEA